MVLSIVACASAMGTLYALIAVTCNVMVSAPL